ncbi:IPT/TIG domain-containing protein [Adhaeribacter arboris]|uniref:IPT/TIG domain-containing protein n=1 Tax=Adhaeribacter arboris TaxID=2072846 RepID=UPI001304999F|nr:IPT/TIG domain-containing protein [Adhaeribacter arboris]
MNRTYLLLGLVFLLFNGCSKEDDPDPVPLTSSKYDIPVGILNDIFITEKLDAEKVLDKMKEKGMVIQEGTQPPEIYLPNGSTNGALNFTIEHNCIYDDKNAGNQGSSYGKYEQSIQITRNPDNSFAANISYTSVGDPNFPEYPRGMDTGSGTGYVTGKGNNFTIFFKTQTARFDQISYNAIWIISGTVSNFPEVDEVTNITKCMIMLEKGADPDDKVANPGTIRIFQDTNSPVNQADVVIADLSPSSAFGGTLVTINGSGFAGIATGNTVMFANVPAEVQTATTTQLTVIVPPGPSLGGQVAVTVQVKAKKSNSVPFDYLQPDVIISDLSASSGPSGIIITLNGSGFSEVLNENNVFFGKVPANVQAASANQLIVVVPPEPQGGGPVNVTVQVKSKISNSRLFTYLAITNFSPNEGTCFTPVSITGYGFSANATENIVRFNGVQALVRSASSTELEVEVPFSAGSGPITVEVNGIITQSGENFSFLGVCIE